MDGRRSGPWEAKQRAALFTSADKKSRPAKLLELVPGPANNIHSYMDTKSLINLGLTSPQMESSLKNAVGDLVRDDLLFKNFWEEQELDKYYYSLPMNINVPGDSSRREKILYKIKKDNVSVFYGGDAARYFHRFGLAASQIGCLNTIKYFDKEMRIYDFPYPVPTIDEPAELDNDWKRAIHYRWGGKAYFNLANIYKGQNKLEESIYHFKKAIELNSSDMDAKINFELLKQMLKQEENKEDQSNQGNEGEENQEGQEDQSNQGDEGEEDQEGQEDQSNQGDEGEEDQEGQEDQTNQGDEGDESQKGQEDQSSQASNANNNGSDSKELSDKEIQAEAILNALKDQEKINQKQKLLKFKAKTVEKDW